MPLDGSARLSRREQDAARRRLAKMRAEAVVTLLVRLTREALAEGRIVTPLNREAIHRQLVRTILVWQGWPWPPADNVAAELVRISLDTMNAKRPDWYEGQPDYVIHRGTLVERTRCANCGKRLEETQRKFCSQGCNSVHHRRLHYWIGADAEQTARMVARIAL